MADWNVITGDCFEVMRGMVERGEKVAHVVSDPPYGVHLAYATHNDTGGEQYESRMREWQGLSVALSNGFVCFSPGVVNQWIYPRPRWVLGWAKKGSTRRSFLGGFNEWEPLLVYGGEGRRVFNDCAVLPDCQNHTKDEIDHPCPKPVALLEFIISGLTDPGDLILDPFCGSGTTGVACIRLGRRFIGIEKDEKYAAIARERLEAESRGLSLKAARAGQTSIFDVIEG